MCVTFLAPCGLLSKATNPGCDWAITYQGISSIGFSSPLGTIVTILSFSMPCDARSQVHIHE